MWDNIKPTCFCTYENDLLLMNSDQLIYRLPLHRFYVVETFTAQEGQINFTIERGWFNTLREDIEVINGVEVKKEDLEHVNRTIIKVINGCNEGDLVEISYLSLHIH